MAESKLVLKRLDPAKPKHGKIRDSIEVAMDHSGPILDARLVQTSRLNARQLKLTMTAIKAHISDVVWVFESPIPEGEANTACGVHVDDCPNKFTWCFGKTVSGCATEIDCDSEACAASFACAGGHGCGVQECADNTCHPSSFTVCSNHIDGGCEGQGPVCIGRAPPACNPQATPCDQQIQSCPTDANPCLERTCFVDTPDCLEQSCLADQAEDEGSDQLTGVSRGRRGLRSVFASPVWAEIVTKIAKDKPSPNTPIKNISITLDPGLFDE